MDAHETNRTFDSGAVRDGGKKPSLQLISPHAMTRLGEWLRYACEDRKPKPYPVRNWETGMPFSECVASLQRHVEKFKLGDSSEDHVAAVLFNAMAIAHFEEEIKAGRLPERLDDMPHYVQCAGKPRVRKGDALCYDEEGNLVPLIRRVKEHLDAVFNNPHGVYAGEDIQKDAAFYVRTEPSGRRVAFAWRTGCPPIDGVALESLPTGVPIKAQGEEAPPDASESAPDGCVPTSTVHVPFTVYLCGPITGRKVDYDWREQAATKLAVDGIKTLDPLRGKRLEDVHDNGLSYMGQLAAPEIAERDRLDIEEADVVLAHFPYNPPRQSIGSWMEMGAAAIGLKKPVIVTTDLETINKHLFCRNFCILEPCFDQAIARVKAMAHTKRR